MVTDNILPNVSKSGKYREVKKRAQRTMGNVVDSRGITAQHSGDGSSGFLLRMCVPSPASSSRMLVLAGRGCTHRSRALSGGA